MGGKRAFSPVNPIRLRKKVGGENSRLADIEVDVDQAGACGAREQADIDFLVSKYLFNVPFC
jgi:hypothetical protein